MAISTLTIDIVAKLASLEKDLGKATRIAEQAAGRINSAFRTTGAVIGGALAGIGIASVVQGFRSVVDQLDALNDAADATGASIENLSALEDIGRRTGAAFEDVSSILIKFNNVLKEADGKNGASMALKAIGLDAEALKRIDPAEALRQTAVALSQFADDGNKARLVQELFGKSVKDAAPFLKDLAEAGKLNATVTTAQAEAAERFNKQIFAIEADIANFARTIVSSVLPAIQKLTSELNDGIEAYGGFWSATADIGLNVDPFKSLNENLTDTVVKIRKAKEELASAQRNSKLSGLAGVLSSNDVEPLKKQIELLEKREKYLRSQQSKQGGRGSMGSFGADQAPSAAALPSVQVPVAPATPSLPKLPAAAARDDSAERYIKSLNDQINKAKELSAVELANFQLATELKGKTQPAQEAKIRALASELDQKTALADIDKYILELTKEKATAEKAASEEAARYYEASLTPADELAEKLKRINELYEAGAFGGDSDKKRAAAIKAANDEFTAQDKNLRKLNSTASEFSNIMLSAIQNGDDLGKALEQIAMKAFIFEPLSKAIDGLFSGASKPATAGGATAGGSSGGDAWGMVGSLISAYFGGFFAEGGSPPVGKVSVVGERGPELFVPQSAGTIIPNKALGGQSVVINQQISIGEGVSANGVMSAMQASKEMAKAEVMQILRGRGVPV